jgi:hypothetical protein
VNGKYARKYKYAKFKKRQNSELISRESRTRSYDIPKSIMTQDIKGNQAG